LCLFVGNIITDMTTPSVIASLPNPNDSASVEMHRSRVLSNYHQLFGLITAALTESVPRASETLQLHGGPFDLAVHAMWTRYLVKLFLSRRDVAAQDETVLGFQLEQVSNCGLCLCGPGYEIRILKGSSNDIPKAESDNRKHFYNSNQMHFAFPDQQQVSTSLKLIVLWNMNGDRSYAGIEIACPRGERSDRSVDCYWIHRWRPSESVLTNSSSPSVSSGSDLDEIRPLSAPRAVSE
jgi:hypothetical protein